jgi:hypothetical protein
MGSSALRLLQGMGSQLQILWSTLAAVVLVALWIGPMASPILFLDGPFVIWLAFDLDILPGMGDLICTATRSPEWPFRVRDKGPVRLVVVPVRLVVVPVRLVVVPVLLALNRLLPYVELREPRTASPCTRISRWWMGRATTSLSGLHF